MLLYSTRSFGFAQDDMGMGLDFSAVIAGGGLFWHLGKLLNCTVVGVHERGHLVRKCSKGSIIVLITVFFRGLSDKSLKFLQVFVETYKV